MRATNDFCPQCLKNIQKVIHYAINILCGILGYLLFLAWLAWYYVVKFKNSLSPAKQKRESQKAAPLSPIAVQFDDSIIKTTLNGTDHEAVAWQDVANVVIRIEDDFLPMPYWYIGNGKTGIRIPNDAIGEKELLDEFTRRLPGYDCDETYLAIIEAMAATDGIHPIWRGSL